MPSNRKAVKSGRTAPVSTATSSARRCGGSGALHGDVLAYVDVVVMEHLDFGRVRAVAERAVELGDAPDVGLNETA